MDKKIENPQFKKEEIIPVDIEDQLKSSFLDYAMSVIISRALPDVRDGLKPVHRRILYAMYTTGNLHNKPFRKSARIAGDVIGKYHPHGEAAVYDTIVRLAQDFSMRYPLVDGQGNFGSIDGDPPAAMRYTEVRMTSLAEELLYDIEFNTVDFVPNYDNTLTEPTVLPARFPNLLVNGSAGIAVGMATSIPPHNIRESIDAIIRVIDDPDVELDELMKIIPGPDFPTGGIIHGKDGIRSAYETGKGSIRVRAVATLEELKGDKEAIIITEIPYLVNKSSLVEEIAEYIRSKKIESVSDIRDESDREGLRIVIEMKRGSNGQLLLNQLFKHTKLEIGFQILFLAIKDNVPRLFTLKDYIRTFIDFRKKIVIRRSLFELNEARRRAHILEGIRKALNNLDEVIELIRGSASTDDARHKLVEKLELTEVQADEILGLKLSRLTQLEQDKIVEELAETLTKIDWLERLLKSEELIMAKIKEELLEIKEKYGDERRTKIIDTLPELAPEDLIEDKEMVISVTLGGYMKRTPLEQYRSQRRGGKGIVGMATKEEDFVTNLYTATNHETILFFTRRGLVFAKKVWEIPELGRASKGVPIVNLVGMPVDDKIATLITVREFSSENDLFLVSRHGYVKRLALSMLSSIRRNGLRVALLDETDELVEVELLDTSCKSILIVTREGRAVAFNYDEVRQMGRAARGVIGVRLKQGDRVVGGTPIRKNEYLLVVTENGYGKRTRFEEFPIHHRGAQGVIVSKITEKTGPISAILSVKEDDEIMLITTGGTLLRMKANEIPVIGRITQGVKLINLQGDERVSGVAVVVERDD